MSCWATDNVLKQRLPDAAGVDRGAQCEKRRSTNLARNGLAQSKRKESVLTKFLAITQTSKF